MNTRAIRTERIPWYREPWPWILFGIPAVAVVAGFVTLVIAIIHRDGLVAEDYYKQGLAINRVLEREARAAQLGLEAHVMVADRHIRVRITNGDDFPAGLVARLIHPTRAGEDHEIALAAITPGWYQGKMPEFTAGRWYVQLEDGDSTWRLKGVWQTGQQNIRMIASGES
ncbi:MAG: FixH family protein [Betaproteobacteria bacterium]|nr:MAG: FixH family protein [Betaproteobacteria bacterium]